MNAKYANYLLNKTKLDYNLIGHDFSSKRMRITPDIIELKKYANSGDVILDLGCGNGRLSEIFSGLDIKYIGVDASEVMVDLAREKYPNEQFEVMDFFHLPFPSNYFDKIYCLSVLHHIPSVEYRQKFLKEARRVLKPNGQLILTVWYLLIKTDIVRSIIKNILLKMIGRSQLDFKDVYLHFNRSKSEKLADRYLHAFSPTELVNLISSSGFKILEKGRLRRGLKVVNENLYAIATKK